MLAFLKTLAAWMGILLMGVTALPPSWYASWLARPWTAAHAPVLIVLGGDSVRSGILGLSSYWRCVYALDIWRESGARGIVLSGDPETTASMRSWLMNQGIPAGVFTLENRSHSTHENALFTAELLRGVSGPYLLLTSDIHVWRASRCFSKAGLAVFPRPAPDALKRGNDWRDRWRVFLDVSTECGKIAYYKSKGWI